MMKLKRRDLKKLAGVRLKDVRSLMQSGCFSGAYYLLGYAVECALKAVIAKQTGVYEFPNKKRVNDSYTHDLVKLFTTAGLDKEQMGTQTKLYLATVYMWNTQSRYTMKISKNEAEDLFEAVTHPQDRVLSWLKTFW